MVQSFRTRLALACGAPLLLGFVVFSALIWQAESRERTGLLLEKAKVLADSLVNQFRLEDSVVLEESRQRIVNAYLNSAVDQQRSFDYISVLDPFGRIVQYSRDLRGQSVLAEAVRQEVYQVRQATLFPELGEIYVPLLSSTGELFGLVRFGVPAQEYRGVPMAFVGRMALLGLVSLLPALALAVLFSRRFLSRGLAPLIRSVERVSEGDFTRRVDKLAVREELVPLTESLNRLFETIELDKKRIHRLNSGLQEYERLFAQSKTENLEQAQRLSRQINELEACLERVLSLSGEGIFVLDQNGRLMLSNPPARRMLRLERSEKAPTAPQEVQRRVSPLFASAGTDLVEGNIELQDAVFLKQSTYRFRAQRLPASGGQQQVLVVMEDSTRSAQMEKQKDDLENLIRHSLKPALKDLVQEIHSVDTPSESTSDTERLKDFYRLISSRLICLEQLVEDWEYWQERSYQVSLPPTEQFDLVELLKSLPTNCLGPLTTNTRFHLPEQVELVYGSREDFGRLFSELMILVHLAVPGPREAAVDMFSDSHSLRVIYRKSADEQPPWSPPRWLERLSTEQPLAQDSWINLKLSIVRFLASQYGIQLHLECHTGEGKKGVILTVELPVKATQKPQDRNVDDLIKRFLVAPV